MYTEIRALKKKDAEETAKAKSALLRERKITDQARAKVLDHEKCETALYKKITIINELRAKI